MNSDQKFLIKEKTTLNSTLDDIFQFESKLVKVLLGIKKISKNMAFEVRLAFHEAIINVVIHTYKKDPNKKIDVSLIVNGKTITVVIRDYGKPVEVSTIKSRDLNDLKQSGLGVHFYKTLMDIVEYSKPVNNLGNIIKMVKKI